LIELGTIVQMNSTGFYVFAVTLFDTMWVTLRRDGCCVVAFGGFFQQLINITLCPAFLGKFVCQTLCCVPLQIQTFIKILSSSLNTMLIVDEAVTSAVTNF